MKKSFPLLLFFFSVFILAQKTFNIQFYTESNNIDYMIYADNQEFMPISAKFHFNTKNLNSSLQSDEIVVIPPKSKRFLISKFTHIDPYEPIQLEYSNTYNFGDVLQENYDADYVYSLPFEKGKTHLIFQGYDGKFSHQNQFALDLNLKMGDKVFAAREGTVVEVVDRFDKNCADISCAPFGNKIIILHRDGTFGDYGHLKFNGSVVKKGDIVKKDQLIGFSGKTGFSSGPHLHFAVFINRLDGKRTTLKTLFKTSTSAGTYLEEGKNYTKNY